MPSLSDALKVDTTGYTAVSPTAASPTVTSPAASDLQPTYPTMMRCPLPPIFTAQPDSLRQFYLGNTVPQTRMLTNSNQGNSGGGGTTNTTVAVFSGGSGGTTPTNPTQQQAVFKTGVLSPGQSFAGTMAIAKGFQLLSVSSTNAARLEMYGSANAQSIDLSRAIDAAPPAGSSQGIICDVVLDTAPYTWFFQNRVGANSDTPQAPLIYVTLTNLSPAAIAFTATFQYASLES